MSSRSRRTVITKKGARPLSNFVAWFINNMYPINGFMVSKYFVYEIISQIDVSQGRWEIHKL